MRSSPNKPKIFQKEHTTKYNDQRTINYRGKKSACLQGTKLIEF